MGKHTLQEARKDIYLTIRGTLHDRVAAERLASHRGMTVSELLRVLVAEGSATAGLPPITAADIAVKGQPMS